MAAPPVLCRGEESPNTSIVRKHNWSRVAAPTPRLKRRGTELRLTVGGNARRATYDGAEVRAETPQRESDAAPDSNVW